MDKTNLNSDLYFYLNLYKYHLDWVAKGFFIYFLVIGTTFGFIINIQNNDFKIFLLIGIFVASLILYFAGFFLKIWLKNFKYKIIEIENKNGIKLWHLFLLAPKVILIIKIIGIFVALLSIIFCLQISDILKVII